MTDFDPNKISNPIMPKWATYIKHRRPEFKIHNQLGHAKNALHQHFNGGTIYEYVNGEWVEYLTVAWRCWNPGCGEKRGAHYVSDLRTLDGSSKLTNPVYCYDCRREMLKRRTAELMQ